MAKTIRQGALISGTGLAGGLANPIHSHAGRVLALVINHAQLTTQTVTLYDAVALPALGSEIATFHVSPHITPTYLVFPRDQAIPFATGLCVDPGITCDVQLWSVDYG